MLLREVAEHLEGEEDPLVTDVAFRERDALLLREECLRKYDRFEKMLAQMQHMQERLLALKEELCRVSPEALELIEREGAHYPRNCEEELQTTAKKSRPGKASSRIAKKNDRRKKGRN